MNRVRNRNVVLGYSDREGIQLAKLETTDWDARYVLTSSINTGSLATASLDSRYILTASYNPVLTGTFDLRYILTASYNSILTGTFDSRYILTASYNSVLTSTFDSRYILTSSLPDSRYVLTASFRSTGSAQQIGFWTSATSLTSSTSLTFNSASVGLSTPTISASADISGSGAGIFNTGYKTIVLQFASTSSLVSGTTGNITPPFAVTVPWTGSLAGMSVVAEGAQPNGGGKFYIKANVNSAIVADAVLTASNTLTNPNVAFPRGLYAFNSSSLLQITCTVVGLAQTSVAQAFTGYVFTLWAYM